MILIRKKKIWKFFSTGTLVLFFFLSATALVFEVYTLIVTYSEGHAPLPKNFGNFERVRALLKDDAKQKEFSFAVVGDTKGRGTFERIVEKLREEPLSFMVLLGDCVREGTPHYHRYLRAELAEELSTPFPVFYVVGNHDIDRNKFPINRFEKTYGPTIFSFDYQGCLFIMLRVLPIPYSTKVSADFLESLFSGRQKNYRKIFVFMHIPPPVSPDFKARAFENSEKFIELFNKYHIDYVFAGDCHNYARVKFKNTVYLVTGGGGAHLEKGKFGRFHHAMVIKVTPDSVSERILQINRQEDFEDTIEMYALAEVYPRLRKNWLVVISLNIIISLFWLAVAIRFNHYIHENTTNSERLSPKGHFSF